MEIRLDLSRHCIETAARLKVEALIRSYFKTRDEKTEGQIQALTRFLEGADFHSLRHTMAREEGPGSKTARLLFPEDIRRMEIRFNGMVFRPLSGKTGP